MFELQRRSLEQGRQTLHWNVDAGRQTNELLRAGIESNREIQAQVVESIHRSFDASLDAVAAATPGGDDAMANLREAVDEQFAAVKEIDAGYWDVLQRTVAENTRTTEQFADNYLELVDASYEDSLELLGAVERDTKDVERETNDAESTVTQ